MKRVLMMCCISASLCADASAEELLVSNFFSNSVNRFSMPGGSSLGALGGPVAGPLCARLGPDGDLYVASEGNNSILRYDGATLAYESTFVPAGSGGLNSPTGIAWGSDGNMYVSSYNGSSVLRYDGLSGAFLGVFVTPGAGGLSGADNGMTFGPDGNLYVPSYNNNRVLKYDGQTGAFLSTFIASIGRPRVLEFRGDSLFVTSETSHAVRRYNAATGAFLGNFVAPGSGGLSTPVGMVFGGDGLLYVGSSGNNRVLRFDASTGAYVDQFLAAPGHPISGPTFLTIVPAPGVLVVLGAAGLIAVRRRRA